MRRAALVMLLLLGGCLRQAEGRADGDLDVGTATAGGVSVVAAGGLAHVRDSQSGALRLWALAPVVDLTLTPGANAEPEWLITIQNVLADARLTAVSGAVVEPVSRPRPTMGVWKVTLSAGTPARLRLAPPDADRPGPYRFAVMSDIQTALDRVDQVFAKIDAEPGVRFVASAGDIVQRGQRWEYDLFEQQLETLDVPYYSTIGNHELIGNPALWRDRFGRFNVHFAFKGVYFSMVDSGSATIDPIVYDWLDDWMDEARGAPHLFFTHIPPIDPIGVRQGSFRSRNEAAKLLSRLANGEVALTIYGHIHSYYDFQNAGIPARISGGGGAWPEKFDGIGRHFLVIDVDPARADEPGGGVVSIDVVRVDQ